jgi:hypothetical protein
LRGRSYRLLMLVGSLAGLLSIPTGPVRAGACGAWSEVGLPDPSPQFDIVENVDAVSTTDAWAVGSYGTDGSGNHALIDHWNGSAWTLQSVPHTNGTNDSLMGIAEIASDDVWAVGFSVGASSEQHPMLQHFDGSTWSSVTPPALPSGDDGELLSVSAVPGTAEAWAVGYRNQPSEAHHTLIMHYDGSAWSVVPSPDPSGFENHLSSVVALSATNVWAGGYQTGFSFVQQTLAIHWRGSNWTVTHTANVGTTANLVRGISAAGGKVYAVGTRGSRTLIERWNGSTWLVETSVDPGTRLDTLTDVVAVSAERAWAVGFDDSGGAAKTLIEHRSSTGTWSVKRAPSPALGANLWAVDASSGSDMWAVGQANSNPTGSGLALHRC